ncbi:MAG: heavy metal-associated domain-containing protein [Lachnospiraceae bacterium]|nr:heavy-metal-associated domain-containing protein [Agathobacter rectalis]MDD6137784.1 heavy metal-associated domain-containing protein [Lachnospiraceae bacterium]MDY6156433.1 heavy metal-associated domain-containing protein [Agathobacter sp.]
MDTLITILIVAVIAVLVIAGLKETIKHAKGEGACCGGGNTASDEEPTVILSGKIVTRMNVYIDGMHCMNCKNSVTRSLQKLDQVSAKVDLKKNMAYVESTRNVGDDEITFAIERLDFNVTRIEHIS